MNTDARQTPLPERERVRFFDVDVTPLSAAETAAQIIAAVTDKRRLLVGNLNLHGVYVFYTDPVFREFCEASDLVLLDGAPLAWAAGAPSARRVGSTDWLDTLMPLADGLHVVAIGGTEAAARGAEEHMRREFPGVEWTGYNGFEGSKVSEALRTSIAKADIVLVGMGMPLQERWILEHREVLGSKVAANVGGCMDYYAGVQRLAPRWLGRIGMEWAYRLVLAPRRLAARYLIEPFKLAGLLAKHHRAVARGDRTHRD